jgi:hypothetical protein
MMEMEFESEDFNRQNTWRALSGEPGTWYQSANDSERTLMKTWLLGLLLERNVDISFEKADGTHRVMTCTLQVDKLPPINKELNESVKKDNPDVCKVWDCTAEAWRSFRWDRLKRIEFKLG